MQKKKYLRAFSCNNIFLKIDLYFYKEPLKKLIIIFLTSDFILLIARLKIPK